LLGAQARKEAIALLDRVGLPDAAKRVDAYPHQFSGGQRQRVTIAMALACEPDVLIADEPTTALDVTIQGQILDLIADLVAERGMSMILISHDLGVIAENVQRMMVMYGGTVVESGATNARVRAAGTSLHAGPVRARPRLGARRARGCRPSPARVPELADLPAGCAFADRCAIVEDRCRAARRRWMSAGHHGVRCVRTDVSMASRSEFWAHDHAEQTPRPPSRRCSKSTTRAALHAAARKPVPAGAQVHALNGVSAQVMAAASLGVVGESGSGKSTFARLVMALERRRRARCAARPRPAPDAGRRASPRPARFPDGVSGSLWLARPAPDVARIVAEPLTALGRIDRADAARARCRRCCGRSACATPTWTSSRTNSPAASASASRSRAR
jgi:ABC-type dipeptide/oligopeptide/nickel transport system ATPase component